jgi:hypothetical protein
MLTTVDPRVQMSGLIMGFVPAQAIAIAAELGIADLVAREPMTAKQLAQATSSDASALFRVLRYLASLGIFQADEQDRFALTPMAELLRSDAADSMRSMGRIMGRVGPGTVSRLVDAVRSGKNPFALAFGQHLFEYLPTHPDDAVLFDAAMNGFPRSGDRGGTRRVFVRWRVHARRHRVRQWNGADGDAATTSITERCVLRSARRRRTRASGCG